MSRLIAGTSSWSEKAWVGPFYPEGTPPGDFLALYAERYPAVEADVTYYRVPDARLVDGWKRKTPEGFRLCAKFPRSIVHAGEGPRPDATQVLVGEQARADTERFLEAMGRLGERCGPLVLQFPYFNRGAFSSPAPFLERLEAYLESLPAGFRYAVEVRNRNWIAAPLLDVLRRRRVPLVLVDLAYMPHADTLAKEHDLLTGDFVYTRLIGDRKRTEAAAERFDRVALDLSDRLERWAVLLFDLLGQVEEVFAFANNHFAGYGPGTIDELVERVARQGPVT
jgi:uncharacterized protein YecE (DUF72 family)